MAAYDTLRAAIDSYIKANGNKEITGTVLNDILNAMVSALGADTRFAGVAVPTTNPGNPEGNVVYFASQAGTYSNFGGIVLPLGIHILVWNGTAWTSQTWFSVDNTPTQNSQNLALSGGILQAIVDAVGVERLRAIGVEVTSCSFDSTTKKISFFNSANTTLFQLDATAFVIDGMVSDVKIEDGNLVIQFNTDAGKQDIEIPLTDIFNPANYYTKTAIDALLASYYTKTETDVLLTAINNKLADGCLYRGMAEPTTNPPTPTTKVFYIATKAGTYTNFGNIAVTEGITILKHDGSNWSKEQICYSDGVFDISAYNGTSYADLSAALGSNGANIPQNLRKGGMSVKFVQSSDNKYVQWFLMAESFTTDTNYWYNDKISIDKFDLVTGINNTYSISIPGGGGAKGVSLSNVLIGKTCLFTVSNIASGNVLFLYKTVDGVTTSMGDTGYASSKTFEVVVTSPDTTIFMRNEQSSALNVTVTMVADGELSDMKKNISNNTSRIVALENDMNGMTFEESTSVPESGGKYVLPINYGNVGYKYHLALSGMSTSHVLWLGKKVNGTDTFIGHTDYSTTKELDVVIEAGMTEFFIQNQDIGTSLPVTVNITSIGVIASMVGLENSISSNGKVVKTIKTSGGDFSTFRAATEYIKNNPNNLGYLLKVYEGTYDVFADYSQAEINAADFSTGFGGIDILDGVDVVGVGCRDKIIIKGEIDNEAYTQSVRTQISTLQLKGNCSLENLTITSNYIRYTVHDDFAENVDSYHRITNCKLVSYYDSNATSRGIAYGLGTRSGLQVLIDRCEISNIAGHNNTGFSSPEYVELVNSKIGYWGMSESDSGNNGTINIVNTDLLYLVRGQYLNYIGIGQTNYPIIGSTPHKLGNTVTKRNANGILEGQCVKWHNLDWAEPCNSLSNFMGICIGFDTNDDNRAIIQTYGYISEQLLGNTDTSGWAVGTYLGVGADKYLSIVNSRDDAVAVVEAQYNSIFYIKML